MPPADVDDDYFNDLSRQPNISTTSSASPQDQNGALEACDPNELPKTKRIACVLCRKRKLKCDGTKPKCSTCARLGHNCAYDEVRRKSGPKRGYVKELEARLGMSINVSCLEEVSADNAAIQLRLRLNYKARNLRQAKQAQQSRLRLYRKKTTW